MTAFTKEKLIESLQHIISVAAKYPGLEQAQIDTAISNIALASLEAKPIGAFHIFDQQVSGTSDYVPDGEWPIDEGVIEVYAAPPAPAVIDERALFDAWNNEDNLPIAGVGAKNAAWLAWQARSQLASLPSPAPVVPEKMIADPEADVIDPGFIAGWNACRAAMLNSPSASKGE